VGLVGSGTAHAAQTSTWGIIAAPDKGAYRSDLSAPANGGTIHEAVVVFNRTREPVTVDLSVVGVTYANQAYQFSGPRSGLAADVSLAASSVALGPNQQATVPVTIHEPRGVAQTLLAGVAAEAAPVQDGALSIQQRLVVLIKSTPSALILPRHRPDVLPWGVTASVVLGAVGTATVVARRKSRPAPTGTG
jgi:hypothetical protein